MFYSIENFYTCSDLPDQFYTRKIKRPDTELKSKLDRVKELSNDDFVALILLLLLG